MENRQLRERLEALHAELARADRVDPASREVLQSVLEDIRRLQEHPAEGGGEGLVDRLREAVAAFEESHPALTEAAGRVVDALAKIGI
jgi:signal transduction histidine kinase